MTIMWRIRFSLPVILFVLFIGAVGTVQAQDATPEPTAQPAVGVEHPGRPITEIMRTVFGFSWLLIHGSGPSAGVTASNDPAIAYYAAIPHSRTADGAFVLGDPNAPVSIIVFEDFTCPACQNYKPTMDSFVQNFVVTG